MTKYDTPLYDEPRRWIQKRRERNISWAELDMACRPSEAELRDFLGSRVLDDDWPELEVADWRALVKQARDSEEQQKNFGISGSDGALLGDEQDNGLTVPASQHSSWQCYRSSLGWKDEEIDELERATRGILNRLSTDTREIDPVKGLVLGYVQSGKTSSMEALMAMAADHGWNVFVVLSGLTESLRLQTLERMVRDLNEASDAGNLNWKGIEHPGPGAPLGSRPTDLNLAKNSRARYFTVCLKQKDRLQALIDWLHESAAKYEQMKILVIDDEADQASISNTVSRDPKADKTERRGINKLITDLVGGKHWRPKRSVSTAQAMNYVMYTATPYANMLNEATRDSLYPRNFIWSLKPSDLYIGPNQVFGYATGDSDAEGIDMIRLINREDLEVLKDLMDGIGSEIPDSLKDAIAWFVSAAAVMRGRGRREPISMLVHTSRLVRDHDSVATALTRWINASIMNGELLRRCERVYEDETTRLNRERWLAQMPDYGRSPEEVEDYPPFYEIVPEIERLLSERVHESRLMSEETADIDYGVGLHRVIDNSDNDDSQRLVYPDPAQDPYPSPAPAFIIIGGNTLSRGLTLDGLVTSYFLRTSAQADTLMQMGRWFGYRVGYELLPRVWMTGDTHDKFRFLAAMEADLRDELRKYMLGGVQPREYGPRIMQSPRLTWLRPTSAMHMRGAVVANASFVGCHPQTVVFDDEEETQLNNLKILGELLDSLGEPLRSWNPSSVYWKGVPMQSVLDTVLSDRFVFSGRSRVFNELRAFREWIHAVAGDDGLGSWNVIVAGSDNIRENLDDIPEDERGDWWQVGNYWLRKVQRSRLRPREDLENVIDIKVLRNLRDHLADIDEDDVPEDIRQHGLHQQHVVDAVRKQAGEADTPYLLVYRINRNSPASGTSAERVDLHTKHDLVGLQVVIPGDTDGRPLVKRITVRMPDEESVNEAEDELEVR